MVLCVNFLSVDKIPEMSTLKGRKGFKDVYHDYLAHWLGAGRKQKLLAKSTQPGNSGKGPLGGIQ